MTQSLHSPIEQVGSWIGPYRLVGILGEGGMGIVYQADQTAPIRRRVALKVIKPGMDSARVVARFDAERQALALLDHPNIAQVYSAGTTENGRPYFVMEYVRGLPITDYCDHHKLRIEDRLRLFQQVCLAVHHAHQKGIIHRDIKPSNTLVSTENDQPMPKVIDFGVAKAISQPLTERTVFTEDSQLLGTPEYMSPEQAEMANEDIDTRSDIYSLGVLLYELITGVLPFDTATLREGGIDHVRRVIRETEPKTPSTRLTKLGEQARKVAESRRTEVALLTKRLRNELEWIPLKAMHKERCERYRSASELADDIDNYLGGEPLIAGPLGTSYRLKKYVQRNRMLVSSVGTIALILVAGVVVSAYFAIGQARARVEAEHAATRAQAIADFLTDDVLSSAAEIKGREATVRDVLDAASNSLANRLADEPLVEARICTTLASTYWRVGDYAKAAQHQQRLYEIYLEQFGKGHETTTGVMNMLAVCCFFAGRYDEAVPLYEQAVEEARREKSIRLSPFRCNLAATYAGQGRYDEAEELLRTTLLSGEWDQDFWPEPERMAQYGHHLGDIYRELGRYEDAERWYRVALQSEPVRTPRVNCSVRTLSGLGRLYMTLGDYAKAEEQLTRGIEVGNRELPGKGHPWTLRNVNALGVLRTKQKRCEEAETLLDEALTGQQVKLGPDHPDTLMTIHDFGVLRREQNACDEAEKLLTQALNGRQTKFGPDHPACFESMHELALLYLAQRDYENAAPLLIEAYNGRKTKLRPNHPHTVESLKQLVKLYDASSRPEEADKWRRKLTDTQDSGHEASQPDRE